MNIPGTARRVNVHTRDDINRRIQRQTDANIAYFAQHPQQIEQRLRQLDREWDIERWLQMNSAVLSLVGITLALARGRKWILFPMLIQGFFLQHGLQGWCPPLPPLRRLGVRTQQEIQLERHALKALRGEYAQQQDQAALESALH